MNDLLFVVVVLFSLSNWTHLLDWQLAQFHHNALDKGATCAKDMRLKDGLKHFLHVITFFLFTSCQSDRKETYLIRKHHHMITKIDSYLLRLKKFPCSRKLFLWSSEVCDWKDTFYNQHVSMNTKHLLLAVEQMDYLIGNHLRPLLQMCERIAK